MLFTLQLIEAGNKGQLYDALMSYHFVKQLRCVYLYIVNVSQISLQSCVTYGNVHVTII